MRPGFLILMVAVLGMTTSPAQIEDQRLARQLADESQRERAIDAIVAGGSGSLPLLLSWVRSPPDGVNQNELTLGMAEAFGRLGATQAVPFLISHITARREPGRADIWMKEPAAVEAEFPSIAALIRIGPEASKALISDWPAFFSDDDARLAAMFVIARVPGVPDARTVLLGELGRANLDRFWAEQGLRNLGQ